MKYVSDVLDMRSNRPRPDEIGVISPFRKQVRRVCCCVRVCACVDLTHIDLTQSYATVRRSSGYARCSKARAWSK